MQFLTRRVPSVVLAVLVLIPMFGLFKRDPTDFGARLGAVIREQGFDLVGWEVRTLGGELLKPFRPAAAIAEDGRAAVREFLELGREVARLRAERVKAAVLAEGAEHSSDALRQAEAKLAEIEVRQRALAPAVQIVIARQLEQVMQELGIRRGLIEAAVKPSWPPLELRVVPAVYFRFEQLPLLLVVAPRDRITVRTTKFLKSDLTIEQMESLETSVDRLSVTSLVTPIGGFAAFPTMIPTTSSLHDTLITVAHEWAHHYLTLRPLGLRYFKSYEFRSINETVASIVSEEIGTLAYERYYREGEPAPAPRPPKAEAPAFDFYKEMARTRGVAEGMLARGEVEASEQYLARQRQVFIEQGYFVRKLNNAYLTFYGSYGGSYNVYEPKLRALRERSGSLIAFLRKVAGIWTLDDFERLTRL